MTFDAPAGCPQPRSLHQPRGRMADVGPLALFDAPLGERLPMVGAR